MGINSQSVRVCMCVWGWQSGRAGRQEGCAGVWTTYVNLSDRYVNNATHNYQGIKCVPCINKIMLRWGRMEWRERKGKKNRRNRRKRREHKTFKKNGLNKNQQREEKKRIEKHYVHKKRNVGRKKKRTNQKRWTAEEEQRRSVMLVHKNINNSKL